MPRPPRITYENALYHVMNRGRACQRIFHEERYYQAFLNTLEEVHQRFNGIIHAYCLLGNHYHLLLETPNANLSRIMRHINGVYTQRHNRLKGTDGPLFRGRYKSILVDEDAYLLELSRYIHRNPIEMKRPLVKELANYRWSSYPAYIGKTNAPAWLYRETTYSMLGHKQRYKGYANYVMQDVDEDISQYYNQGNQTAIMGTKEFKEYVYERLLPELEAEKKGQVIAPNISMDMIIQGVAKTYRTSPEGLAKVVKGPQKGNEARKIAMYLCQEMAALKLKDIAKHFGLNHVGSVSFITHQVRKKKHEDHALAHQVNNIIKSIMKQAT